ncbi:MAG TPA: hypothetical protein IAA58_07160 [Candidatus Gallacutalibacter stercoravium]|nr:hypothetical protein [Candidatus Gallacutalibacter stercoravium]
MKVTIAYIDGEEQTAGVIQRFVEGLLPKVRIHQSDNNPPYKHIYLTTKKPHKPSDGAANS